MQGVHYKQIASHVILLELFLLLLAAVLARMQIPIQFREAAVAVAVQSKLDIIQIPIVWMPVLLIASIM